MTTGSCSRIEQVFPDYFSRFKMPEGAKEESITVYRACKSGKCDRESFLLETKEYGILYIDRIFLESNYPVIFTCVNDAMDLFICVCCQNNQNGTKWLIGKTTGNHIVDLLKDRISLRDLLVDFSTEKISMFFDNGEYKEMHNESDWDAESPYLPKSDSFMHPEDGEFDEDIDHYSDFTTFLKYGDSFYKQISDQLENLTKGMDDIIIMSVAVVDQIAKMLKDYSTIYSSGDVKIEETTEIMISSGDMDFPEAA